MTAGLTKKIDDLSKKLAQLKAKKSQSDALHKFRVSVQARKTETRKKILIGSFVLNQINETEIQQFELKSSRFDEWLKRADDRRLFGLLETDVLQTGEEE